MAVKMSVSAAGVRLAGRRRRFHLLANLIDLRVAWPPFNRRSQCNGAISAACARIQQSAYARLWGLHNLRKTRGVTAHAR